MRKEQVTEAKVAQKMVLPISAKDFKVLMGRYEKQNPKKFEQKREALEKKLALLSN